MNNTLDFIEKFNKADSKPQAVIIWLHGLGADANDFVPIVPELNLKNSIKFVFPNASMRPITINNGYLMRGWYDIKDIGGSLTHSVDTEGIEESVRNIEKLIKNELEKGFTSEQILLAGFSQGGVISYVTGINTHYKLAGILALSCYLPESAVKHKISASINKDAPFFACHGLHDMVVPYFAGIHAYNQLKERNYNIKWAEYSMGHSVCIEELNDISTWIDQVIEG